MGNAKAKSGVNDRPGIISLVLPDSKEELDDIRLYMSRNEKFDRLDYIAYLIGNDEFLFTFFDLFAGERIEIPSRAAILRDIQHVRIYRYCAARGFTEPSYQFASAIFKKNVAMVKRVVERVGKVLGSE